jgi:hypothetical protein
MVPENDGLLEFSEYLRCAEGWSDLGEKRRERSGHMMIAGLFCSYPRGLSVFEAWREEGEGKNTHASGSWRF